MENIINNLSELIKDVEYKLLEISEIRMMSIIFGIQCDENENENENEKF